MRPKIYDARCEYDVIVVLRDFNAKVGRETNAKVVNFAASKSGRVIITCPYTNRLTDHISEWYHTCHRTEW